VRTAGTDPVTFEHDADTSVELRVHAARPGLVVLGDTYYPGWDATVDGRSAAIHPTNVAFRGVLVPAGTHTVRFDYRPQSVRVGGLISLLSLVAIVGGLVLTSPRVRIPRTVRRARRQPA
jgi:uncharacterized membrane protein YfhO